MLRTIGDSFILKAGATDLSFPDNRIAFGGSG
jgi:hypothetical protein